MKLCRGPRRRAAFQPARLPALAHADADYRFGHRAEFPRLVEQSAALRRRGILMCRKHAERTVAHNVGMFRFETSSRMLVATTLALLLAAPAARALGWQAQGPQSQEVRDSATGLVWRRCVEGMYWTGETCAGQAVVLDWSQAQARARAMAQADGHAWKLPTLSQLKSLGAFARAQPSVFAPLFPQAPHGWYWSASSTVDNAPVNAYNYGNVQRGVDGTNVARVTYLQAWALQLGDGEAQENLPKRSALHVRLVRTK